MHRSLRSAAPWLLLASAVACRSTVGDVSADARHAPSTQPSGGSGQGTTATRPSGHASSGQPHVPGPIVLPQERRLANVRMLTHRGENAEAYWSFDDDQLIFQARRGDEECDRILIMSADGNDERVIAHRGAHTCGFFLPGDDRIVFSSTMTGGDACPPKPDRSRGYVWAVYGDHEIYTARADGSDVRRLTFNDAYDAESTVSPTGKIVFTSTRDGDLDIYTMNADGSDVKRLTNALGYDGGPFWSPDGTQIVYRARHPTDAAELADYQELLAHGLVRPGKLDIWIMNADGSGQRPITDLEAASFAPTFTPDGRHVLFASNHEDPQGRNFDLFLVSVEGGPVERVTYNDTFDGFPMFSHDGRHLAFCSNRGNAAAGETNVFVAEWVVPQG